MLWLVAYHMLYLSHAVACGMCHEVCKSIPYDHVVRFYGNLVWFFKTTDHFILVYLKVRNYYNHGIKTKLNLFGAWSSYSTH